MENADQVRVQYTMHDVGRMIRISLVLVTGSVLTKHFGADLKLEITGCIAINLV